MSVEPGRVAPGRGAVPAVPRHAATVVLLRDSPAGLEAYLLRRVASMAFAAGMYVFPGGSVDPADAAAEIGWTGPSAEQWVAPLSADAPLARALVCAAVRETFEESGVLLAGPDPDTLADVGGPEWEAERVALETRRDSLSALLARRGLLLRADLLRPWAHWITPEAEPRRFDTRFFVAALPAGQQPRDVGGEADRVTWVRPRDVAGRLARGDLAMLPPTAVTLEQLAAYEFVADVLAAPREVHPVLPRIVGADASGLRVVLPGEPGYDEPGYDG